MQAIDIDLIVTVLLSVLLCGSGVAAVSALPWREGDMERTVGAARRLAGWAGSVVVAVVRGAGSRVTDRAADRTTQTAAA